MTDAGVNIICNLVREIYPYFLIAWMITSALKGAQK